MINIVSYGGGTNSTAMLIGLKNNGEKVDYILFSDTGGEKPHTYEYISLLGAWCKAVGFPEITILKPQTPQTTIDRNLENECLRLGCLPSKAYGFGSCSDKWKVKPQQKFVRDLVASGITDFGSVCRMIGFDADEPSRMHRAQALAHKALTPARYPLIEWGWGREECVDAIREAGLTQPGKSACFFCPSTKKKEILDMRNMYPNLLSRALEIERKAMAGEGQAEPSRCGLGRNYTWKSVVDNATDLCEVGMPEQDCGCYDGD